MRLRPTALVLLLAFVAFPLVAQAPVAEPLAEVGQTELSLASDSLPALPDFLAATPARVSCAPRASCCKVCSKGKACGNSCISRRYMCHKEKGCACDAVDLCR